MKYEKSTENFIPFIHILYKEENTERFFMYFRMSREQFQYLYGLIQAKIKKMDAYFREAILSKERLAVCLR